MSWQTTSSAMSASIACTCMLPPGAPGKTLCRRCRIVFMSQTGTFPGCFQWGWYRENISCSLARIQQENRKIPPNLKCNNKYNSNESKTKCIIAIIAMMITITIKQYGPNQCEMMQFWNNKDQIVWNDADSKSKARIMCIIIKLRIIVKISKVLHHWFSAGHSFLIKPGTGVNLLWREASNSWAKNILMKIQVN